MIAFRLSASDRAELRKRAEAEGMSVQSYLEWKALGRPPQVLHSGRPKHTQDRLPMTG